MQMISNCNHNSIRSRKVAIIGVGFVGASIAYALTLRNLARDIILVDIDREKSNGEAMDIQHGIPYMGVSNVRDGDYSDCMDCDLIIITAGRNRHPGETRLNMMTENTAIIKEVVKSLKPYYTRGVIFVVSNPVDILVSIVDQLMGLPNGRVLGTGCILDTSRLVRLVAEYVGLNTEVVKGFVVGEHGDSQIPIWSRVSIAGVPLSEYCLNIGFEWTMKEQDSISAMVRGMGATIIKKKRKNALRNCDMRLFFSRCGFKPATNDHIGIHTTSR